MRLRADFKQRRQEEAVERQEALKGIGPKMRLEALDERLGVNTGAKKERARLRALLAAKPQEKLIKTVKVKKVKSD